MGAMITFCGGAGTVTGANFLLDTGSQKILVDCGSHAQEHVCDTKNFEAFPYDPASIQVLIVTHSHADHIGRIPKLVKDGFRGVIYSTEATKDISSVMFDDALSIMQSQAEHQGCDVLYERGDITRALDLWKVLPYHQSLMLDDVRLEFLDAGHVLGSALVKLTRNDRVLFFSGDIGNCPEPLLNDTEHPAGAHYILMESVYGDRLHEGRAERTQKLKEEIEAIRERKGTLLIPSFSIERTQVLLFEINDMIEKKEIAPIAIYVDAPLANRITEKFRTYANLLNPNAQDHFAKGDDPFAFPGLSIVNSTEESRAIHLKPSPKIIIAGAGMSAGGRIRAHEKYYLGDKHTTILFVGYQAPGTLGRRIQDGADKVQIDGEWIRIHARIAALTGYSGHADRDQLMQFVENAGEQLEHVFVTMGEPKSSLFFAQRIKDFLGIKATAPETGDTVEINF